MSEEEKKFEDGADLGAANPEIAPDAEAKVQELVDILVSAPEKKKKRRRRDLPPKERPKIHNIKSPHRNPYLLILEQHTAHRVRIAKTIAMCTFILIILFIGVFQYNKWKLREGLRKEIEKAENGLRKIDDAMKSCEGYSKNRMILDAYKWIDYIASVDSANYVKWDKVRQSYLDRIVDSRPVVGGDFIISTAAVDMVFIPRGQFIMGRLPRESGAKSDELPRRKITLTYDFWISRTEVTNSQYRDLFPAHIPKSWSDYSLNAAFQPVVRLDWHAATSYCAKITEFEKAGGRLPENYEYRLPTEAEWEYACRAGTDTIYYWGDTFGVKGAEFANSLDIKANKVFKWKNGGDMALTDGFLVSSPVASYKPNAFGLYDMSGNVWEWCYDWYNPRAYKDLSEVNPVQSEPIVSTIEIKTDFDRRYDADCTSKVVRGGSWGNLPSDCRSAARSSTFPEDSRNTGIGFRVVLGPAVSLPNGKSGIGALSESGKTPEGK